MSLRQFRNIVRVHFHISRVFFPRKDKQGSNASDNRVNNNFYPGDKRRSEALINEALREGKRPSSEALSKQRPHLGLKASLIFFAQLPCAQKKWPMLQKLVSGEGKVGLGLN